MAAITQHSKIRVKRSTTAGVVPTIGTTNDHTDGTWSNTDIYVGEYFYNVVDNRLWIGKLGGVQEISTAQLFELTYAEAELQKTIVGSPSGDGLIIGAKYKITDKGDTGIILTAIDLDKFSFYGDELTASPAEHRACIYDFNNDLLTYPSGANYKVYKALITQTGTNAPVATELENNLGTITFSYIGVGSYSLVATGLLTTNKTIIKIDLTNFNGGATQWISGGVDTSSLTTNGFDFYVYDNSGSSENNLLLSTPIIIEVYN